MRGVVALFGAALTVAVGCDCGTSHVREDVGTGTLDAPDHLTDARPCVAGEPCDCRAVSLLPSGTHWVGVDYVRDYVGPAHRVTLTRDAWIGTYEASAGCYDRCIREGICTTPHADQISSLWEESLPSSYWTLPDHVDTPMVWLVPEQADTYCAWLGGRLPTSAEFEKLTRGEDGRTAPWMAVPEDPRLPPDLNFEMASGRAHNPNDAFVRSLVAIDAYPEGRSLYGHYNVIGNALEWVQDDFVPLTGDGRGDLYPGGDRTDPLITGTGNRLARSDFGSGWRVWDEDHAQLPTGVRCAFDTRPEMLAR
jgi:formylglycine-generating enzyme required for sulfatase activity